MLGRQPVEEHCVGDLPGQAAHLGTERRHDEAHRELGPQRGDPVAHTSEGAWVRAPHTQEETTEGKRVGAHPLDDAVRSARVEGNHPDPDLDTPCLRRGQRERRQPIGRAGMVHPEGAVPEPLGLPR